MAPFYFEVCGLCGRRTKHWHRDPDRPGPPGGDCGECGTFTPAVPADDGYWVTFTNMTNLVAAPAAGEYVLTIYRQAGSEAEALDAALAWAARLIRGNGAPPHGLPVPEERLRREATVMPDREVFRDGLDAAFARRRHSPG